MAFKVCRMKLFWANHTLNGEKNDKYTLNSNITETLSFYSYTFSVYGTTFLIFTFLSNSVSTQHKT